MDNQDNIQSGDVINVPNGPFWPKRDRVKISQAVTALLNFKVAFADITFPTVKISGRNLVLMLPKSLIATPQQSTPTGIVQLKVTKEYFDHLDAIAVTGPDAGKVVSCAKPEELINKEYWTTIYGMEVYYNPLRLDVGGVTQTSPNKRFSRWLNFDVSGLDASYKEVIYPKYVPEPNPDSRPAGDDAIILATKDDKGGYYDLNIRRKKKWVKEVVVCTANGTELSLIDSTHVYSQPIKFSEL